MMRTRWLVLLILLFVVIGIAGCSEAQAEAVAGDPMAEVQAYCLGELTNAGFINASVEVTPMYHQNYEVWLTASDPDGMFVDMGWRVTVFYDGFTVPIMYGGFE